MDKAENSLEYPQLRPVEVFPLMQGKAQVFGLRDPYNVAKNILVLPLPLFFLVSLFDGKHSLLDLQEAFMRQFQELIPRTKIQEIIAQLDAELFMESETFRRAYRDMESAFRSLAVRPASHAGTAYEQDPQRLQEQLGDCFRRIENETLPGLSRQDGRVKVLIAPHIDIRRGGIGFAYAYREIARRDPADLFMIFGTAHQSRGSLLTLTKKNYATPLGALETDVELVEKIHRDAPFDVFLEEILHRDEHSVEFQAVFLRYVLGDQWLGKIVPILCGSFHPYIQSGKLPRQDPKLAQTLDLLRQLILEYPGTVTVIAGVDFSHVGKRFGNPKGIPPSELERVQREDETILQAVLSGDAEMFFHSVEAIKDRNNLCGLSAIYMALDVTKPSAGNLLTYQQAVEPETESVVSYAGVSFYDKE